MRILGGILWTMLAIMVWLFVFSAMIQAAHGQTVSIKPDAQNATTAQVACGAASTAVLAASATRRSFSILTASTNTATLDLCLATTCVLGNGIPLPAGAAFNDDTYLGPVSCIRGGAAQSLSVAETAR